MRLSVFILMLCLTFYTQNIFARDCPGDMMLWQEPGSAVSDCVCPMGQKLVTNITNNPYYIGSCQNIYNASVAIVNDTSGSFQGMSFNYNTPLSFSGLVAWYDADDPLGNGTKPAIGASISTWYDKSGNGYNLISHGTTPTYTTDTARVTVPVKTVYCNGGYYVTSNVPTINYSSGFTAFMVLKPNSLASGPIIVEQGDPAYGNASSWSFGYTITNDTCFANTSANNNACAASTPGGQYYLGGGSTTAAGQSAVFQQLYQANSFTTSGTFTNNSYQISLCGKYDGTSTLVAHIAEIIIYNTKLSIDQIVAIREYLNQKWASSAMLAYCTNTILSYSNASFTTTGTTNYGSYVTGTCTHTGTVTATCSYGAWVYTNNSCT